MAHALTPILVTLSLVIWVVAYFSGSALFAGAGTLLAAVAFGAWVFTPKDSVRADADSDPAPEALTTTVESNPIPETLDAAGVLRTLLSGAGRLGAARAAHLWADDQSAGRLRLVAVEAEADGGPSVPLEPDGLLQNVLVDGMAALQPVTRISTGPSTQTVWRYAVPVGFAGFRGVAAVDIAGEVAPDLVLLNQLAAGLRMPLVCALVLHVSEGRAKASRVLMEATRDLSRSLIPEDVIAASLARAMTLSSAATGSIMLVDAHAGRLNIAAAEGLPSDVVRDSSVSIGEGIAGWVAASGKPVLVEDLPGKQGRGQRHGVRCALSVPIADQEGLLGVLNVGSRAYPAAFTEGHMEALEMLGRQTAVALRNARAIEQSQALYFDTLKALVLAMETKDPYATGGTDRIVSIVSDLGREMGLAADDQQALELAALLHDIGMAAVVDAGVTTPGPLTTVERGLLKMHPKVAAEILTQAPALRAVAPIVFHHHERFDGAGYGGGVSGADIPVGARILAVADAWVAMTSDRPYRKAKDIRKALDEMRENEGTQFDPDVVQALVRLLESDSNRVPQCDH